jgi:hypothetical protein
VAASRLLLNMFKFNQYVLQVLTYEAGESGEYKMVLVVRQDLGMGKGKAAAQVISYPIIT